jgi:hypothetical protein
MAVTITRTQWIDDDGTGTSGTVINNAEKTTIYNQIDAALAQLAPLAGGNAFSGNQSIAGTLTVNGAGNFVAPIVGQLAVVIQNQSAANTASAALTVGNDHANTEFIIQTSSTGYTASGFLQPGGTCVTQSGINGLVFHAANGGAGASIKFATINVTRLQIAPTGELGINVVPISAAQLFVATDGGAKTAGIYQQNLSPANALVFMRMANSAGGVAGDIAQSGASGVIYGTTSDARLKDDRGRASDLSALRALVVHDFTWKVDGVPDRGVFAQDAQALFPRAVSAGTDDRTERGDLQHPWMTDYSKFVPDLIVGWQHHDAELAALRAAFATLKG